jgi:hypothetical protein
MFRAVDRPSTMDPHLHRTRQFVRCILRRIYRLSMTYSIRDGCIERDMNVIRALVEKCDFPLRHFPETRELKVVDNEASWPVLTHYSASM